MPFSIVFGKPGQRKPLPIKTRIHNVVCPNTCYIEYNTFWEVEIIFYEILDHVFDQLEEIALAQPEIA